MRRLFGASWLAIFIVAGSVHSAAAECALWSCESPQVTTGDGELIASNIAAKGAGLWVAEPQAAEAQPYTYRLVDPCVQNDATTGSCQAVDFQECPAAPDRVVDF